MYATVVKQENQAINRSKEGVYYRHLLKNKTKILKQ